jgi:glycosyltransferase involved in cell wall biosynthesis
MKLVVFAHTPPPHHGQSYMVKLMLDGLGGDLRKAEVRSRSLPYGIQCFQVNARVSRTLEDVGGFRLQKFFLMLYYCAQAVYCRYRYGAVTMYYVPAPGKAAALYRDWLVMALCRPFFKHIVFHWHATSLSKWLERNCGAQRRALAYRFMGKADLSLVLSEYNKFNAEKLLPQRIEVVPNGIPDPCPTFDKLVLPRRRARLDARKRVARGQTISPGEVELLGGDPREVRVLFLAHCTREKGLFDATEAILLANDELAKAGSPFRFRLIVAGSFQDPNDKQLFEKVLASPAGSAAITYAGFVRDEMKTEALLSADLLSFPSHWENQPVTVIEALAFGLPIVLTDLPSVREMLPAGYPAIAKVRTPGDVAKALIRMIDYDNFEGLRSWFEERFKLDRFLANIAAALKSVAPDR